MAKKNNCSLITIYCSLIMLFFVFAKISQAVEVGKVHIHGFISQGYLMSDDYNYLADTKEGSFQFNEIGLNFISEVTDDFRLGIQFMSRDLGNFGNNEIEVDWAYGDYNWKSWLGFRGGILKIPFGLYNENRDLDIARTSILLPGGIYNEADRPLFIGMRGVGIYGHLPYGLSYQAQIGELGEEKIKDHAKYEGRNIEDINQDYSFVIQTLWEPPFDGFLLGLSFTDLSGFQTSRDIVMGPPGTPAATLVTDFDTMYFWVASLEYSFLNFKFFTEYYQSKIDINMDLIGVNVESEEQAYYFGASYRFTDWFELGIYYSEYYENKDDKDGKSYINKENPEPAAKAWLKEWVLSTRFDIIDSWIFKLEGHLIDGLNDVDFEDEVNPSEDWFLFAAKLSFSF